MSRSRALRIFIFSGAFSLFGYFVIINSYLERSPKKFPVNPDKLREMEGSLKRILIWTTYYEAEPLAALGEFGKKQSAFCDVQCEFVDDRRLLDVSHAVVFHSRDMRRNDFPPIHVNGQRWIYLQRESPIHTKPDLALYATTFNWTMTYRRDSDIFYPYGLIIPLTPYEKSSANAKFPIRDHFPKKKRLVAWVVSNCWSRSKREDFVEELLGHIPIDIFGDCGDYDCRNIDCFGLIERNYKFYLSLENSLCNEYVTEKLFNALSRSIVPIVYDVQTDYSLIAPKNSYIDAARFKSTKELGEYLVYLDKNPMEYLKYFEWKNQYRVIGPEFGWCSLCRLLNAKSSSENATKDKIITSSFYRDIKQWWHFDHSHKPFCLDPKYLEFARIPILKKIWKAIKIFFGLKYKLEINY